ncbi:hypothetical protein Fmac_007997 [Flemingia macrophylla]|uniref:Uncharacterized protein n=1 Tax=Flemingia macrophylla TaxID=520843 RepID=A0ABD1MW66_9FABA
MKRSKLSGQETCGKSNEVTVFAEAITDNPDGCVIVRTWKIDGTLLYELSEVFGHVGSKKRSSLMG